MGDSLKPGVMNQRDAEYKYSNVVICGNNDNWKLMTKFQSSEFVLDVNGDVVLDEKGKPEQKVVVSHSTKGYDTGKDVIVHYSGMIHGIPVSSMTVAQNSTLIPDPVTLEDKAKGYTDGWKVVSIDSVEHKTYLSQEK